MKMALASPFIMLFITAAASVAIIQGVVWLILSFMTIFLYSGVWTPEFDATTYGQLLSSSFVRIYFEGKIPGLSFLVTPVGLLVWAIIYVIASVVWIGISIYLLIALYKEKRKQLRNRCQEWAYWTILTCGIDLVLTSLLASDYNYLVGQLNLDPKTLIEGTASYLPLAIGVLMTLAARGFVLWILNLTFALVVRILPIKFFEGKDQA